MKSKAGEICMSLRVKSFCIQRGLLKFSKLSAFAAGALSLSLVNADTTADYAQNGLVACWDGYENDGAGVHSAAITAWRDIVGGRSFELTNVGIGECSLIFTAANSSRGVMTPTDAAAALGPAANGTVEVVMKSTSTDDQLVLMGTSASGVCLGAYSRKTITCTKGMANLVDYAWGDNTFHTFATPYANCYPQSSFLDGAPATALASTDYYTGAEQNAYLGCLKGAVDGILKKFFSGEVFAVRVYNRVLTPEEIAANHAVDVTRFVNGDFEDQANKTLLIVGDSSDLGVVNPAYGAHNGYSVGQSVPCSAPAAWTNADETVAADCVGYAVYTNEAVVVKGSENAFTYVHPDCATGAFLVWRWAMKYKATAEADAGGTVSTEAAWVSEGDIFSVTATPATGMAFRRWRDAAGNTVSTAAELSMPVAAPMALTAEFGQLIEITSGNEDDAATINAAIQSAPEGAVVHLADGIYNLTAPIVLDRSVTLAGNDADRTKVVLDGARAYRLLEVMDENALACGMTFERGYSGTKTNNNDPAPVHVTAGTVFSCICHDCDGDCAGGVTVYSPSGKTAIVKDTLISDCEVSWVSGGIGGGLRLGGSGTSIADGCVVSNCTFKVGSHAVRLDTSSAKLLNSTIVDCPKGGVYVQPYSPKAIVSNCVVRGCSLAGDGAGIYNRSGSVVDSLVVGNSSTAGSGGGIYNMSAVSGCTVVGNTATGAGPGVYQSGGSLRDSIVWYNGTSSSLSEDQSLRLAGGNCNHTCATQAGDGEGNITDRTPAFVDPDGGDYRLTAASPCRGAASDGTDMGCFRFVPSDTPSASFAYALVDGMAPVVATFTAAVEGATALKYVWDFGDGESVETDENTVTHEFKVAGQFSVTLTVKTAGGDLTYAVPKAVSLAADTVYVSTTGSNTFPYSDWATAATDIRAAVDAVVCSDARPGKVCLADDTYVLTEPIVLNKAVELVGNEADRTKVVLDGGGISRLVELKHERASVRSLTFENGKSDSKLNNGNDPAPVHIAAGTVSSCICNNCNGDCVGGVSLNSDSGKTAALKDTLISGCQIVWVNGGVGGGLHLAGSGTSLADCCVISNCTVKSGNYAVRLRTSGAKLLNSTVVDCPKGGITVDNAGSTVSNCVVRNCSKAGDGAGIYNNSGNVIDSLVVGNSSTAGSGGGIYNKGTVAGCTIVGNTAITSGPGVYQSGGSLVDSIVWYNGTSGSLSQDKSLMLAGGTCTHTCATLAGDGEGNVADKAPSFVDPDGGDYRLTAASPCRGAGSDGRDMGCFRFVPSDTPSASFAYALVDGMAPVVATFTAAVEGATALKYVWDFGDGEPVETDENTVTHEFKVAGQFAVTLTVKTAGGDLTYAVPKAVSLAADTVYVSTTGSNTFPYSDWATAATDIRAAVDAVVCSDARPGKVYVGDGTYPVAEAIELDKPVELVGNDADRTQVVLDGGGTSRLVEMKHEQAFVHGLTLANGKSQLQDDNSSHGPVNVHCGTVSNCVCRGFRGTYCGALSLNADSGKTAVVKDTFIYDCFCDFSNGSIGGGLRFNGTGTSLADGCVVSNCQDVQSFGVAVRAANARFVNSLVVGCTRGGIYQTAGLVDRCRILGNSSDSGYPQCAGVYLTGGTIRNCLVAGNTSTMTSSGIRANDAVTVENCTVADNKGKGAAGLVSESASATWRNTLSWNNSAGEAVNPDVTTPETPGTFDHCLTGVDPRFRSPAKGDYHVRGGSPARNGGVKATWMDGATDLDGNKRIRGGNPDVGCYEDSTRGLMLLVQ